ncbi:hypothetical protein NIES4072_17840 [Nostoc commune NIES-4072]|uniref:Uncharacterized protein n=1 Tax=Nostoc commune NIES-4072 TaxID=2005467 RepID=A0A2R5FHK8_NOSCO|nr:hypothetical protein NIES4070_08970 [Nostoc commune HK-02]GBG18120.1 hypothetical protein NIES4072_17840 [Nostoc commune NIES-4072]
MQFVKKINRLKLPDFTGAENLEQQQIELAKGDRTTILPEKSLSFTFRTSTLRLTLRLWMLAKKSPINLSIVLLFPYF